MFRRPGGGQGWNSLSLASPRVTLANRLSLGDANPPRPKPIGEPARLQKPQREKLSASPRMAAHLDRITPRHWWQFGGKRR